MAAIGGGVIISRSAPGPEDVWMSGLALSPAPVARWIPEFVIMYGRWLDGRYV